MKKIFYCNGHILNIRKILKQDLDFFFYEIMSLLTSEARNELIANSLYDFLNNGNEIFLIDNIDTSVILAVCVIRVDNENTLGKIGNINSIKVHNNYKNIKLENTILTHINEYLKNINCIKIINNVNM
tara:strand:+ start:2084 stop:2467 length:384 start_codon:yes stop_codon:yes gene_type:complete